MAVRHYKPPEWDKNTELQNEIWTSDAASDVSYAPPARKALYSARQRPERQSLASTLEARGLALHDFELEKSLKAASAISPSSAGTLQPSEVQPQKSGTEKTALDVYLDDQQQHSWEQTLRPPLGSGYKYSTYAGKRPTLAEQFQRPVKGEIVDCNRESEEPVGSRRERIEALERGMRAHDESRLREIGLGTNPLVGPDGPLPLPWAPIEDNVHVMHQLRQRLVRQRVDGSAPCSKSEEVATKQSLRNTLTGAKILGADARENPDLSTVYPQWSPTAAGADTQRGLLEASLPSPVSDQAGRMSAEMAWAKTRSLAELLQEAEGLVQTGAKDDYWIWVSMELCAKAYEASSTDVLRMVRTTGAAACSVRTARAKRELLRAAEHLLSALSSRMQEAKLEFLCEILEAMCDAGVGTQIYLDMIMAHLLAQHHCDCQALDPHIALKLASALGRLAQILRLRPQGIGGPSTSTNSKFLDVLQRRLASKAGDCYAEELACLDSYYLTRLCGEKARNALVCQMAELQIGFREASKHYLPFMLRLQQALRQELSDSFRWSLPPKAREYLTRLGEMVLAETAPWTQGATDAHNFTAIDLRRKFERRERKIG